MTLKCSPTTFQTGVYHSYHYQNLYFIKEVTQNHHHKNKLTTTLWSQGWLPKTKKSKGYDSKDPPFKPLVDLSWLQNQERREPNNFLPFLSSNPKGKTTTDQDDKNLSSPDAHPPKKQVSPSLPSLPTDQPMNQSQSFLLSFSPWEPSPRIKMASP